MSGDFSQVFMCTWNTIPVGNRGTIHKLFLWKLLLRKNVMNTITPTGCGCTLCVHARAPAIFFIRKNNATAYS